MTMQATEVHADIRMPELESIIRGSSNVQDVHIDDGKLVIKYSSNGKETLTALVDQFGSDRIRAFLLFSIPDKRSMACTAAATAWNGEKASHGTFAYISKIRETPVIVLESNLRSRGESLKKT